MPDRAAAENHYFTAVDLYADGCFDEAVEAYRAALSADPTFTDALHGLTRAYQETKQYDLAIQAARRITELDPDDVLAHTSLSILFQHQGMIQEAEAEALKAKVLGWKQELRK